MNDLFLNTISAGGYNKSLAIDTEYLIKERAWSVGRYNAIKGIEQVVNIGYNAGEKILTVYVSLTIGGEPIVHFVNGTIELFKISGVGKASLGVKSVSIPSDGIFVFTYSATSIVAGDVLFADFSVYDPFTDKYLKQRTSVAGV